jgi:hypothetical protein
LILTKEDDLGHRVAGNKEQEVVEDDSLVCLDEDVGVIDDDGFIHLQKTVLGIFQRDVLDQVGFMVDDIVGTYALNVNLLFFANIQKGFFEFL